MEKIFALYEDFFSIFFPNSCIGCGIALYKNEKYICTKCLNSLPKTNLHNSRQNMISELLWGKIKFENATSFCFFNKKGILQNIIHGFKYKNVKEVGQELGKHFGEELKSSEFLSSHSRKSNPSNL